MSRLVSSRDITELHLKLLDCEIILRKKEALQPPPKNSRVWRANEVNDWAARQGILVSLSLCRITLKLITISYVSQISLQLGIKMEWRVMFKCGSRMYSSGKGKLLIEGGGRGHN
ncbi:conserved hypothetical protein [Ricinus communis]|uniref:Uncharacterized protein n=1 Tax=Ricinus communis TaxID=3988 RepID=B9SW57_RICCO|nr:conserved hypothetical protein [Ricinus communis]